MPQKSHNILSAGATNLPAFKRCKHSSYLSRGELIVRNPVGDAKMAWVLLSPVSLEKKQSVINSVANVDFLKRK